MNFKTRLNFEYLSEYNVYTLAKANITKCTNMCNKLPNNSDSLISD